MSYPDFTQKQVNFIVHSHNIGKIMDTLIASKIITSEIGDLVNQSVQGMNVNQISQWDMIETLARQCSKNWYEKAGDCTLIHGEYLITIKPYNCNGINTGTDRGTITPTGKVVRKPRVRKNRNRK